MHLTVKPVRQQEPQSQRPPANEQSVAASHCVATERGPYAVRVVPPADCARRPATLACPLRATDAPPDVAGQCCASSRRHCWLGPPGSMSQASDSRMLATLGPSARATADAALPRSSGVARPHESAPPPVLPTAPSPLAARLPLPQQSTTGRAMPALPA